MVTAVLFVVVGVLLGSWMTFIFNSVNTVYLGAIIYWVKKADRRTQK